MRMETVLIQEERNATLVAHIQEVGGRWRQVEKRPGALIIPGGAYEWISPRESDSVVTAFLQAGYQVFLLHYSVGAFSTWPNPLEDYERAMEIISERTDWNVDTDRICVVGMSAGGHLAACAATMAKHRPAAAILGYPVIKKDICDFCRPGLPQPVDYVDEKTVPCFLFTARDDDLVDVSNTLEFAQALGRAGVSFETHIYSFGGHGFSTGLPYIVYRPTSNRAKNWVSDSQEWLEEIWGVFETEGCLEPTCPRHFKPEMTLAERVEDLRRKKDES